MEEAKLLKNQETGKVRFMIRQEKTKNMLANHYVTDKEPFCDLRPHEPYSEKMWEWTAPDCADGETKVEQLALKFGTPELAQAFKKAFDEAKVQNAVNS